MKNSSTKSPLIPLFQRGARPEPISPTQLTQLLKAAWHYRQSYVQQHQLEAFRLVNGAGDELPGLFVDVYAGSFVVTLLDATWKALRNAIEENLNKLGIFLPNSASGNFFWNTKDLHHNSKVVNSRAEIKIVKESDFLFEVQLGENPHTGLFLDQRENRQRIRALSKNKRVLNLFCYTGAFTIAALKGGASEVHSVDLSKNYLQWLQRNLTLNKVQEARSFTHCMDVFQFLKKEVLEQSFDLIILDPPTFSRSRGKNFSTEKNLAELIHACTPLLSKNGKMFISVNTQKLSPKDFQAQVKLGTRDQGLQIIENFSLPLDFRLSAEEKSNPYLKACLVG